MLLMLLAPLALSVPASLITTGPFTLSCALFVNVTLLKQYVPFASVAMLVPLKVKLPVLELYEYVPLIPLPELYEPQGVTDGSTINDAGELFVMIPPTVALPESDTVVPAVALPVMLVAPDMLMPTCVERALPDILPLLPMVIVPLLSTFAALPLVAG